MTFPFVLPLALASLLAAVVAAQDPAAPAVPTPQGQQPPAQNPFAPFDRAKFEAAAQALGATPEQMKTFAAKVDELGVSRAADDLLRAVVPSYDAGVKLYEAGDPGAAVALTKVLQDAAAPLLRAHVRYQLARLFLDSDAPEFAVKTLNDYLDHDINVSPLDAEAAFFYAQALAEIPMPEQALGWYAGFLKHFPTASERFRSAAHQRIGEIQRQQESKLHQLADGMKKTTRDLRRQKTDKPVQMDQERYLTELDLLIEEEQKKESQSSGPPSGLGPSSNPAANSALVEGEGTVGNLNKRPSLADRWGPMRDAERAKIEAQVQKGLTPQYQKMLEEYYKKLGKAQGKQ